jgi:multiple sugar transport system permease protein
MATSLTQGGAGEGRQARTSWWMRNQRKIAPYLFISPFYVVFAVFFLVPVVFAFILSFFKWNGVGAPEWIGIENFARITEHTRLLEAMGNSVFYILISLFINFVLALSLALVLNSTLIRGREALRTLFFTPAITSVIAISIVFLVVFNAQRGILNQVLGLAGVEPIRWLESTDYARWSVSILIAWEYVGFNSIYFLAALQTIPKELLEAATIDGAGRSQTFRRITLPLLRPVLLFVGVTTVIGASQIFNEPMMLTEGGPQNTTATVAIWLYREGIGNLKFGYASAIGVVLFLAIFAVSVIQLRAFGIFRTD